MTNKEKTKTNKANIKNKHNTAQIEKYSRVMSFLAARGVLGVLLFFEGTGQNGGFQTFQQLDSFNKTAWAHLASGDSIQL